MAEIEYSLPIHIRAGLLIRLDDDVPLTREHIDAALDALNDSWQDHAIHAGNGLVFADALGPLHGDWRGETCNRDTYDEGEFDLRTDDEKAAEENHPESDWRYEVVNGDTLLGYREWLQHQIEADARPAEED